MIAAPTGSPNIIGLEYCHSDDVCMPLDQSAVNLHLDLERSTMPLDQWFLSVFWQGKAFFCHANSKANLTYWYIKSAQNEYFV